MRTFDYASPRSIDEALALLAPASDANGYGPRALAGGTDLLTLLKADLLEPDLLVDIKRLAELDDRIEDGPEGLTIGALATLAEVETDPFVRSRYPVLSEAAGLAATPQLRNMATLGGNLLQRPRCWYFRHPHVTCWLQGGEECLARPGENQRHSLFETSPCAAVHPSDPAVALLALDAGARLRGPAGEREVSLEEFFAPPTEERRQETVIERDELIVSLRIPALPADARGVYLKAMDRKAWAFALASVAAVLRIAEGQIAHARVVLGGVASIPWRSEAAERILLGSEASPTTFERAAEAALEGTRPLSKNGYKIPLTGELVRRALAEAAGLDPAS